MWKYVRVKPAHLSIGKRGQHRSEKRKKPLPNLSLQKPNFIHGTELNVIHWSRGIGEVYGGFGTFMALLDNLQCN